MKAPRRVHTKNRWMRLSVVVGVAAVCDPNTQGVVFCIDGKDGTPFKSTFECCCCNDGSRDRYYIGPK